MSHPPTANKIVDGEKRSSKRYEPKVKYCKTCGQDILQNEMRNMLMFKDTYHQLQTKEYCNRHELAYSDHKCIVDWCGDCDYLMRYTIEIQKRK